MIGQYLQFEVLQALTVSLHVFFFILGGAGFLILADTSISRRLGGLLVLKTGLFSLRSLVVLDLWRTSQLVSTMFLNMLSPGWNSVVRNSVSVSLRSSWSLIVCASLREIFLALLKAVLSIFSGYPHFKKWYFIWTLCLIKFSSLEHIRRIRRNWLNGRLRLQWFGWAESRCR